MPWCTNKLWHRVAVMRPACNTINHVKIIDNSCAICIVSKRCSLLIKISDLTSKGLQWNLVLPPPMSPKSLPPTFFLC